MLTVIPYKGKYPEAVGLLEDILHSQELEI